MSNVESSHTRPRVLFQLSGSIAAYKACHVISRLVQAGCEVQTVATRAALEFVGAATLEGLTGREVQADTFAPGSYMSHIHLMKWADVVVLCPATANTINKLASGIGDDLLSTLFLAHDFKKPYLIAPAMNTKMYHHPTTRESIGKLRGWGVEILETASGVLACGDIGDGKLLDPELLLNEILSHLPDGAELRAGADSALPATSSVDNPLDILITAGGTKEPIDAVRSITNISTGLTGALIAETLSSRGHRITFVHARDSRRPEAREGKDGSGAIALKSFASFRDLDETLKRLLSERQYDAVIHMAAVSDYSVDHLTVSGRKVTASTEEKIDSGESVSIHLKKNHKILPRLKEYARRSEMVVIGFKLTAGASPDEKRRVLSRVSAGTDLIVHNDLKDIGPTRHAATFYVGGIEVAQTETKFELAFKLEEFIYSRVTPAIPKERR